MATATARFSCGHTQTVNGRNRGEADRNARRLSEKSNLCPDCAYAAMVESAKQAATSEGRSSIIGVSAKQTDYGYVKREESLALLPAILSGVRTITKRWQDELGEEKIDADVADLYRLAASDAAAAAIEDVRDQTDAKFWIEIDLVRRVADVLSATIIAQAKALEAETLISRGQRQTWECAFAPTELTMSLRWARS